MLASHVTTGPPITRRRDARADGQSGFCGAAHHQLQTTSSTLELVDGPMLVVVVAPGDEVVECGGLVALNRQAHRAMHLLLLTESTSPSTVKQRELNELHQRQQRQSLHRLGVLARDLEYVAADNEELLKKRLFALTASHSVVVGPASRPQSPAHQLASLHCRNAAKVYKRPFVGTLGWHNGHLASDLEDRDRICSLSLSAAQQQVRFAAMAMHTAQREDPELWQQNLRTLRWDHELFAVANAPALS